MHVLALNKFLNMFHKYVLFSNNVTWILIFFISSWYFCSLDQYFRSPPLDRSTFWRSSCFSLRTGSWRSKRCLHAFYQIANVCVQILDAKRWLVDYNYSWRNLSFHFRYRQKSKWRKGGKWFFKRLARIYQVIWSLSCNWSPISIMQWSIHSTTIMCSPFLLQDMA